LFNLIITVGPWSTGIGTWNSDIIKRGSINLRKEDTVVGALPASSPPHITFCYKLMARVFLTAFLIFFSTALAAPACSHADLQHLRLVIQSPHGALWRLVRDAEACLPDLDRAPIVAHIVSALEAHEQHAEAVLAVHVAMGSRRTSTTRSGGATALVSPPNATTQRQALMDLYASTNGASWRNNSNWNTSAPICTWYGVGCSGDAVTALCVMGLRV